MIFINRELLFYTSINRSIISGANIYISRILRKFDEMNFKVSVYAIDFSKENKIIEELSDFKNIEIRYYNRNSGLIKVYLRLIKDSFRKIKSTRYVAFRTVYFHPLLFIIKLINPKCNIIWFHDGIIEEISFLKGTLFSRLIVNLFTIIEKFFSRYVDYYLPVSNKMREYIEKKGYKLKKYIVLPCVVDTKIFCGYGERKLKNDNIVIGYAGSLSKWQGFENGCKYVKFLEKNGYRIFFSVLTNEVRKAEEILKKYSIRGEVKSVKNNEVPNEMRKWNFSLCPKLENLITRVASPVKVAEAMAMGIPLIISNNVGDYGDIVIQNDFGIVVNFLEEKTWKETLNKFRYVLDNYEYISKKMQLYAENNLSLNYLESVFHIIFLE